MTSLRPIYIGIGLLVFILGISIFYIQEGFQSTSCSTITNCADCADTAGCGWCSNAKKCVQQNRMGSPKSTCTIRNFITSPTQCTQTKPSFLNKQVSNELIGAGAAAAPIKKVKIPSLIGGDCPSTDKIVETAQGRLNEIIKNVVKTEMDKYKVPLNEGFFDQNKDIATILLASVKDKVTKMVTGSIEAQGYKLT